MNPGQPETPKTDEVTLESWKEIAQYLQRNTTTARRWEKEEGLPVHRHSHASRSSVYAYPSEIDTWRRNRRLVVEAPPVRTWHRPLAMAMTVFFCILMVGSGIPEASAQGSKQLLRQVWSGQAIDGYGAPSPDDRSMAFTDWSTGNLAIRDVRSGTNRTLTTGGYKEGHSEHAVVSPDRRQIAYAWINYQSGVTELRTVPIAGGEPRIAYRNDDTAYLWPAGWTPDERQVLAVRRTKDGSIQLVMISIQDGSARIVKSLGAQDPGRISLSPNGEYAVYSASPSESVTAYDVFVLPLDSGREVNITDHPAIDWSPLWSPDGARVLFLSDRTGSVSLWSVPVEGGKASGPAALVKQDIGFIDPLGITKSGTYYYNAGSLGRRNVYIAELDSGMKVVNPPAIGVGRYINANGGGSFSRDGKYLAYYAFRAPNTPMPGVTLLVIRTLETGAEHEVSMPSLRVPVFAAPPRWFPDGNSVLVTGNESKSHATVLARIDVTNGQSEMLFATRHTVPAQAFPDLAEDGKAILYMDREADASQLMRFDLDSRKSSELVRVPKGQSITSVVASPDGRQLAYDIFDLAKKTTVLEITPATGGPRRQIYVAAEGRRLALSWSQDQRYLLYARADGPAPTPNTPQSLWRVPVAGGEPERIGISAESIFFPQMHPDGHHITFTLRENNAQEVWALENFLPRRLSAR